MYDGHISFGIKFVLISMRMAMLSIFVILCFLPHLFAFDPFTKFSQINLPPGPTGPESVSLDRFNEGPYTGVSDGRILKYQGPGVGFVDFAFTSPNRTKQLCDGVRDPNLGPTCGRPLGFSFDRLTGNLYIVDTFLGLFVVGPQGGQATLLANSADGVRFNFLNGIDVHPLTGDVYFTDASLTFDFRNLTQPNLVRDSSGRLMKYNPRTKEVTILLKGLPVPGGPAVSMDGSFVLFSEYTPKRVQKYWLTGFKANTPEVLLNLPGNPIKIKRASTIGDFWVAVNEIIPQPRSVTPFGYRFNSFGKVLLIKPFAAQYNNVQVNVVQEYNGDTLYVGSREVSFIGIYNKW